MPELPEVETIVRDLNKKILKQNIKEVDIRLKKIIKSSPKKFVSTLKNNSFKKIRRRGKLLIFELSKNNKFLLIHLMMTGQLIYRKGGRITAGGHGQNKDLLNLPNKYSHVIFKFTDGAELFFNDLRRFGVVCLVNQENLNKYLLRFGVEPLGREFTLAKFKELLRNKKTNIKTFLLNQKYVAGIGNIYADEVLYHALISPKRKVDSLKEKEIKKLYSAIKNILTKAIKERGTTFNNYVDADGNRGGFIKFLKVYQREGKICARCKKEKIKKNKIAGRGTRYCAICQK